MRILVVKQHKDVREALALFLQNEFQAKVTEVPTAEEALDKLLEKPSDYDLVICDYSPSLDRLYRYIKTSRLDLKCVVVKDPGLATSLEFADVIAAFVTPATLTDDLRRLLAPEGAQTELPSEDHGLDGEYVRLRPAFVLQTGPFPTDLYLRLSSVRYLKAFKAGTPCVPATVQKFLEKRRMEYVYVKKSDSGAFLAKLKARLEALINSAALSPPSAAAIAGSIHEAIRELSQRLGFTQEVRELARQGIQMTLKSIGRSPQLSQILKQMTRDQRRYIPAHSVMTAQIACSLAVSQSWPSESTFEKLTYAAFFHDMILSNERLARIKDKVDLDAAEAELGKDAVEAVRNHPIEVSEKILTFIDVPAGVDAIILQHHERPDGKGFPRGLVGPTIAPLAALFIVAHDLTDHVLEAGAGDIAEYLSGYRRRYGTGSFRRILDQLGASVAPGAGER